MNGAGKNPTAQGRDTKRKGWPLDDAFSGSAVFGLLCLCRNEEMRGLADHHPVTNQGPVGFWG